MSTAGGWVAQDDRTKLTKVHLCTDKGQSAEVYLHGAHVTSWRTSQGEELIFVSSKAEFAPPKAIRGGVPVCFPQFGKMGPVPAQHGFARNVAYEVEERTNWSVTLLYKSDGTDAPEWPHPCEIRVTVALCDNTLQETLSVKNTGQGNITFTSAFHTYYAIGDIRQVKVTGLKGLTYLNNLEGQKEVQEEGDAVTFSGEVDRIYRGAPDMLQIHDASCSRVFDVRKEGFPDAVVWNPWVAKSKSMADFGDDEWQNMVCLETAQAASGAVAVAAGESWSAKQTIYVRSAKL